MTNLKGATQIDAFNKRLKGNCVVCSIIPHNKLASNLASIAGNIPVELGQLVNLEVLDLRNNRLTGALWYVPSYHTTNWLLSLASIPGNIPVELGQLVNLNELNLRSNKLTGALWYVPTYHTINWLLNLASISRTRAQASCRSRLSE